MFKNTSTVAFVSLIVLILAALTGLFWINFKISALDFGGEDFRVNWSVTRALLIEGKSPYDEPLEDQARSSSSAESVLLSAEGDVLSTPLYAVILTLPFAMIEDFNIARALWMTSQQIALVIIILTMLRITRWQPSILEFTVLFLGIFLSHVAITVYLSGNMIVWTSMFLVLGLGSLSTKRDEIAGGLIALTTFQPQVYFLTTTFILIWALVNKRRLFVVWFFGLLSILVVVGVLFVPGWLLQYSRLLSHFLDYYPYVSPRDMIAERWPGIGTQLAWTVSILIAIILVYEWWVGRLKEYRGFLWTTCLTLVLTRLIGIPVHFQHNLVLFIPLILVFAVIQERWQKSGRWIILLLILIVFIVGWVQFLSKIFISTNTSQLDLIYLISVFLLITLYWVRWWAIRPLRLYIQEMLFRG